MVYKKWVTVTHMSKSKNNYCIIDNADITFLANSAFVHKSNLLKLLGSVHYVYV
jgi:hypothetical protein